MGVYGVVTDIHGNREALDAALEALDRRGVERMICLGDVVGYNAGSDEVVRVLRQRRAICIAGNHDLIALGRLGFEQCWYQAAHALERTRDNLAPSSCDYLDALPPHEILDGHILLLHGDLDDPQRYLRTPRDIAWSAHRVRGRFPRVSVCLFGHTHEPRVYRARDETITRHDPFGIVSLDTEPGELVYVNPGSIDGQRKRIEDRHAELAILDTDRRTIELLRVPYDHRAVERRAREGGYRVDAANKLAHLSKRLIGRARSVAQKIL